MNSDDSRKKTEEFHRLITENTTDMISKHDTEGIILFVSPASTGLVGYTPDELIGRNVYDFFHPDDLENIGVSHRSILEFPIVATIPYRFRHKRGFRDDRGYWRQIESYIQDHSEAEFSHRLCMECAKKYYPDSIKD